MYDKKSEILELQMSFLSDRILAFERSKETKSERYKFGPFGANDIAQYNWGLESFESSVAGYYSRLKKWRSSPSKDMSLHEIIVALEELDIFREATFVSWLKARGSSYRTMVDEAMMIQLLRMLCINYAELLEKELEFQGRLPK